MGTGMRDDEKNTQGPPTLLSPTPSVPKLEQWLPGGPGQASQALPRPVCSLQSNSISDAGVAALMGALCTNQTLISLK